MSILRKKAYLEASDRTQDLLNIKWALRSAGYSIESTWHDVDPIRGPAPKGHWNAIGIEQLQRCDLLVVIFGSSGKVRLELAMMAGFALARDIAVFWVGTPIVGLSDLHTVSQFDSPERFQREVLSMSRSNSARSSKQRTA